MSSHVVSFNWPLGDHVYAVTARVGYSPGVPISMDGPGEPGGHFVEDLEVLCPGKCDEKLEYELWKAWEQDLEIKAIETYQE